jgi:uncharacterized membrane protein
MAEKSLVTRFHLLELGFLVAITATAWVKIPDRTGLPVHWGLNGQPDKIWPKPAALLAAPVIAALLIGILWLVGRLASDEQVDPGRYVAEMAIAGLLGLICAIQFGLLLIGVGSEIDMIRIVAFGLAFTLLLTGIALPRSEPNGYAGVRLPWTMRDPHNWHVTHRVTGVLMALGGLETAVVAWAFPQPPYLLAAIAVAVVVPVVAGMIVSAALALRR